MTTVLITGVVISLLALLLGLVVATTDDTNGGE